MFFLGRFETLSVLISANTASTIGTIIAVVAVLLIHMDRKAVVNMIPNIKLWNNSPLLDMFKKEVLQALKLFQQQMQRLRHILPPLFHLLRRPSVVKMDKKTVHAKFQFLARGCMACHAIWL